MKKFVAIAVAIGLLASSCLPAPATTSPGTTMDLDATAAVFVQQTLQALPSITFAPTNTPVVIESTTAAPTETSTIQSDTSTPDQTASTGTIASTGTLATSTAATIPATQTPTLTTQTVTITFTPSAVAIATETLHPRFYGTLPPNLPYGGIELINKSKAEAYISLQVTTADGSITILEYPVGGLFSIQAPVGKYKYVAWVGGNKIIGSFVLDKNNDLRITIFKDRIEVKNR